MSDRNTMQLAWSNARTARNWNNIGTNKQYFNSCLKLAHNNVDLTKFLYHIAATAIVGTTGLGICIGYTVATLIR